MRRPSPITVEPYRAAAVSGRGPDEAGRFYWRVTKGGARGEDVSHAVLGIERWRTAELVTRALREAAEKASVPVKRTMERLLARYRDEVAEVQPNPQTRSSALGMVRLLLADPIAAADVSSMSTELLTAARDRMLLTYASRTVHRTLKGLRTAWGWAEKQGAILPAWPGVRVVVYDKRAKPVPRDAEVDAICAHLAALDDWRVVAYLVLVETGARRGEVMSLRLDDVDFHEGMIRVRGKLTAQAGPTATRTIPLRHDGEALDALRRWCRDRLPGPLWPRVTGSAFGHALRNAAAAVGVRPMSPGAWRRRASGAMIAAGKFAEIKAVMDHSLVQALKDYNRPEGDAVREAAAVLQRPRHRRDTVPQVAATNARK